MEGLATPRPCGAPLAFRSGASRPSSTTPGSTHGSALALGCACRPGSCTRASARGGRRVVPVAGHDAAAAGVSRRDGFPPPAHTSCTSHGSKPGLHSRPARPAQTPGQNDAARVRPPGSTARRDATRVPYSPPAQEAWREGQLTHIPAQEITARKPNVPPFHARRQRAPGEDSPAGLG
jgi:hypothetical protein